MSQRSLTIVPPNALRLLRRWWATLSTVIRPSALLALLFLVVAAVVLGSLHWATEERQNFLFPFVLVCLWRLPRPEVMRLPLWLPVVILGSWMMARSVLHGMSPFRAVQDSQVYFASERPVEEMVTQGQRTFIAQYNNLASLHDGPKMKAIDRFFLNEQKAKDWLFVQMPGSLLIDARSDWFDVYLQTSQLQPEITELQVLGKTYFIRRNVPVFQLPQEPAELSSNFLLAVAKSQKPLDASAVDGSLQRNIELDDREAAMDFAARVDGHWKSHVPIAAAEFLHGTSALLRFAEHQERGWLSCALRSFQAAAGRVRQKENAELRAAIFNNAAVALLASSSNPTRLTLARRWLQIALLAKTTNGDPTSIADLALRNLQSLGRP